MDNAEIQDISRETRTAVAANRGDTYESGSSYQVEGNDTSLPDISGVPDVATREGTRTLRVDQTYILGPTLVEEQRRPRLEVSPYMLEADLTPLTGMSSELQRMSAESPNSDHGSGVGSGEELDDSESDGLPKI